MEKGQTREGFQDLKGREQSRGRGASGQRPRAGGRRPDKAGEGPHSAGCDRGEDGAWAVPPGGEGTSPTKGPAPGKSPSPRLPGAWGPGSGPHGGKRDAGGPNPAFDGRTVLS